MCSQIQGSWELYRFHPPSHPTEVTIKNLREKLKELEDKLEQEAQTKAAEKEKDLQREFVEKER